MSFFQKYKPESLKDIQGNQEALFKLKKAVENKKPALLYGPPGIGKTISVHALASELNFELIEVNASDTRNKDSIKAIVGAAASQVSLFSKGKIILVDEIDGLSGKEDRGGVQEVASILTEVKQPVVIIANDPWDSKFSTLRKKCVLLEFKALNSLEILNFIETIAKKENIKIEHEELKTLSILSKGDLRAAMNDLETLSSIKKEIIKEDIDNLGFRERKETILMALKKVFKSKTAVETLDAFNNVNMDFSEVMLWVDENLPAEYQGQDLANAYHILSKADIFKGRIRRWQYWRFLAYIYNFLTAGINSSKSKENLSFTPYKRTQRLLKIWMSNQKYFKRKAIAEKLSERLHCSTKRIIQDVVPYLAIIYKKQTLNLELDEEEVEFLKQKI